VESVWLVGFVKICIVTGAAWTCSGKRCPINVGWSVRSTMSCYHWSFGPRNILYILTNLFSTRLILRLSTDSRGNSSIIRRVGFGRVVSGSPPTGHRVGHRSATIDRMKLESMWLRARNDCMS